MSTPDLDSVLNLGLGADTLGVTLDELESEDVTLACFVLDGSSSMEPVASAVIDSYNTELRALRGARTAAQILVSTSIFADAPTLLHGYGKLEQTPELSPALYRPDGCTALYDAVLGALGRLAAYRRLLIDNGVRARALVLVLSDGEDNASTHTAVDVRALASRTLTEEGTVLAYAAFGSGKAKSALAAVATQIGFPTLITASQSPAEIRRVLGQVSASLVRGRGAAAWL